MPQRSGSGPVAHAGAPRAAASLSTRDLLAAACIVLIWGTNFAVMKVGLRSLTPFQLGAARFLFGMLPLILLIPPPRMHWKWIALYGLFQGFGQFALLFLSLRVGMTAALASVLMQTQMFFTALLSFVFIGEKPGRPLVAGMLFAGFGLACFSLNYLKADTGPAPSTSLAGFALCLGAAFMWAVSNIVVRFAQRSTPDFDVLRFLVWCSVVPVLPFMALSGLLDDPSARRPWTAIPWHGWLAAAYLGWVSTLVASSLWTMLLKRHGPNTVAPFGLGIPVVGIVVGMVFLDEHISAWQWLGIVLTVLALACVVLGGRLASSTAAARVNPAADRRSPPR